MRLSLESRGLMWASFVGGSIHVLLKNLSAGGFLFTHTSFEV